MPAQAYFVGQTQNQLRYALSIDIPALYAAIGGATTGSFTATLTGCTTAPTITMNYAISAGLCSLWIGANTLFATSTGAGNFGFSGLPAPCQSASYREVDGGILHNAGTLIGGWAYSMNSATIAFDLPGGITPSGSVGLGLGWSITYPLS